MTADNTARRLIVMRHATSSWISGAHLDHQRPLNQTGRPEPASIAAQLAEIGWQPDLVLSSDSRRTTETWQRMADGLPEIDVHFKRELYHAGFEAFERQVGAVDASFRTVLVLGHNPGWEAVVEELGRQFVRMAPAHAALLVGRGATWWDALADGWGLEHVLTP